MFVRAVFFTIATATTTVTTFKKGKASAATGHATTSTSYYTPNYGKNHQADDDNCCYDRPSRGKFEFKEGTVMEYAKGGGATNLQYVAAIQFDHELKESFTLETSPVIDLFLRKLSANISPIPFLLLHSIAVVI
ncbi:hypothetical protein BOTNAR_0396g00030 [Botryotinia narcissicola]|uniref:Uncharacterized protein n=1 Tax=Botryotinia narcissicola TaxID=278944 RepID=A0A4Z1HMI4_9HELO|nr:hypothetical protein BOTNAR_0396g00030 [Botryotinia narcissicola]